MNGLYNKYTITKTVDGSSVYNAFVLRPDRDEFAWYCLYNYAEAIEEENFALYADLMVWLYSMKKEKTYAESLIGK